MCGAGVCPTAQVGSEALRSLERYYMEAVQSSHLVGKGGTQDPRELWGLKDLDMEDKDVPARETEGIPS